MIGALIKIPVFIFVLSLYILISLIGDIFIKNMDKKYRFFMKTTGWATRQALKILRIRVKLVNYAPDVFKTPHLMISNHMSYLDILILSSVYPSLYITSVEVQKTFFLGLMAKLGGSLFVERRSKTRLLEEIDRIAGVLKQGYSITLFPEGTSTNGERILPFKGALFSTAEKANVNILPLCIRYEKISGKPFSSENRDCVCYYGDIVFFPHLCKLFFVKNVEVTVTFLPEITVEGKERKEIVDSCYESITATYHELRSFKDSISCH